MKPLLLVVLALVSGCSFLKPKSDPTRFFVLTTSDPPEPATPITQVLGIDHVTLPEYLDREAMVARKADTQLDIQDYNRWGEPLRDGFARSLKRDLEGQLGTDHVQIQPFDTAHEPQLLLDVQVRHFEFVAGQGAVLEASWTLRDKAGKEIVTHDSNEKMPAPDKDTGAEVAALSKAVARMAASIGEAVRGQKLALSRIHGASAER
jgi:uncharacterized lipoprotein YmbA